MDTIVFKGRHTHIHTTHTQLTLYILEANPHHNLAEFESTSTPRTLEVSV